MTALLIVDIQNDFLPGGPLSVPEGDQVIPVINRLLGLHFDRVIASKDWHPKDHGSFASIQGKAIGSHILLDGLDQILWPDHCIENTQGAEFSKALHQESIGHIIYKGRNRLIDSYSTFFDNGHKQSTGLDSLLNFAGIKKIYIAGLATDYCVKYSALDACRLGFETYIIEDACRGVNLSKGDSEKALQEIVQAGGRIVNSASL